VSAAKKPMWSSPDHDQVELIKLTHFRILEEIVLVREMLEDPAQRRRR
jgi:hypothetical protein